MLTPHMEEVRFVLEERVLDIISLQNFSLFGRPSVQMIDL